MRVKLTSKNQLTLPEEVVAAFPGTEYFDLSNEDGRIVLAPVLPSGDEIRNKLAERGITDADIADAVAWVRKRRHSE